MGRPFEIPESDADLLAACDVETFRAGGPGGQHQNVTDSGVRLRHRESGVVVSSRVRLARNLCDFPFPGWAKKPARIRSSEVIRQAVEKLPQMNGAFAESMDNLSAVDKQVLVERHLISREHAAKNVGSGVVLNRAETVCVMINEEDHLRMQALLPGLESPSVIPLAHPGMIAIHAVVGSDDVWELLPRLKAAGASGILVLPIEKLVP